MHAYGVGIDELVTVMLIFRAILYETLKCLENQFCIGWLNT